MDINRMLEIARDTGVEINEECNSKHYVYSNDVKIEFSVDVIRTTFKLDPQIMCYGLNMTKVYDEHKTTNIEKKVAFAA